MTRPGQPTNGRERDQAAVPRKWTLHGFNNGTIFRATHRAVGALPRSASYGIGRAAMWLAWRSMASTRAAVADNLTAIFPDESRTALERRARATFQSYARDVIDFIRAFPAARVTELFETTEPDRRLFDELLAQGRGIILLTGHFGNWEIGGALVRELRLPMTIVAMAEADPVVNDIRREMREQLGAETIEVRQSLDTALQIRRCLAANRIVAMLVDRHYGKDRVGVTLFGRRAWFLRTPFVMGYVTGAPVLQCSVERIAPGRFALTPGTPIYLAGEDDREHAIAHAAQQVADALERRIRARPELWYHFYRYWDAQRDVYEGLS